MSDERCFDLHDPKYGTVRALCQKLGYASDRRGTPRSMGFLSLKATTFRKKFVESAPGILHFPLDYESPEARACASSFLTRNSHLFENSDDAQASGWPTLQRDQEGLKDNLAKLMCTQEYLYRRNVNYQESKDKRNQDETENSTLDESDSERSDTVDHQFSPARSYIHGAAKKATSERVDEAQEERDAIARDNIEIHLNFIYPLNGTKDGRSYSWIFNSEKFPEDIKPFAFRYLHERSLYTARKSNLDAVVLFARSLKRHLNITCTDAGDVVIQRRCERLISNSARLWNVVHGYGLLVETDGILRKTAQFEAAWRDRRSKWIDSLHHGNPTGVIELIAFPSVDVGSGDGRKRDHFHTDSGTNLSSDDASTAKPAKRAKFSGFEGVSRYEIGSVAAEVTGVPRRAPEAAMITPLASPPQVSMKTVQVGPEQNGDNSHQHAPSADIESNTYRSVPYSHSPSPSLQPDGSSAPSTATLDEDLNIPPPLEKRSTPYALKGLSLNAPFDVDTALVIKSTKMAPPSKLSKPKLRYILQNSSGVLDHDNPLPRELFLSSNLSEFFTHVATRTGKSDGSLSQLTFVYNWGEREAFVVNRFGGDQYWEVIKERVKGRFLDARNSMKKRTVFELWIKCGDTTNLDEAEEDDDW